MNSQQNAVNDYRTLSQTVIDLRLAWLFVFIDAIVYLFGPHEDSFVQSGWICFLVFFWVGFICKKILENIVASARNARACLWLKYEETLTVSVQENHQKI